jgi:mono/diheme cytochrome c family protein
MAHRRYRHVRRIVVCCAAIALGACQPAPPESPAPESTATVSVERGAYLVQITGCNDCHTPMQFGPEGPAPDMSRMLSGHPESIVLTEAPDVPEGWMMASSATNTAFAGPWGISYGTNLTPSETTGMGRTEQMFIDSMRQGKHMGVSRPVMPPMPWPAYAHMTDDDLKSVFAYLKSIPAIENRVPAAVPAGGM